VKEQIKKEINMEKLTVRVPGWPTMRSDGSIKKREDTNIRTLFTNTGIPGYFTLAQEISPVLLSSPVPELDYALEVYLEPVSRIDIKTGKVGLPSIDQVLWAVGFMSVELENVIGGGAIRFMHKPFRAYHCAFQGAVAWRQIVVRRFGDGYAVQTVCVTDHVHDVIFGYLSASS